MGSFAECVLNSSGLCSSFNAGGAAVAGGGMTSQVIGNAPTLGTGATQYAGLSAGGNSWSATEAAVAQPMPFDAVISVTRVCLSGASGTGSRAFTIRKNAVDTTVTTTITNATCSADTTNSVSVSAGDRVSLKQVTTGTLNSVRIMWAIKIKATNIQEFPILMTGFSQVGAGGTRYHDLQGNSGGQFTEQYTEYIFPTAGTVDRMFVQTDVNSVTSTFVTTLRKNNADTALTASVAAGASTASDTSNSVAVVAGDIATIKFVNNGSASTRGNVGMRFRPTIDGESIATYNSNSNLAQATTQYSTAMGGGIALDSTEANIKQLVLAGTIKKLRGKTYSNLGGVGQTMITKLRKNAVDTLLSCTIDTGSAACSDSSNEIAVVDDDMINFIYTSSATAGSSQPYSGIVIVTTP